MNPLIRALELYVPELVARMAVRRLFEATAAAFGRDPGDLGGLDHRALLERYASFTDRCAERLLDDDEEIERVSRRMWDEAYRIGDSLRRWLGVRSRREELRATRIAYRMIGIDLRAHPNGHVVVTRCAFASSYSPQVCRLMSSLDAGLVAGLTHGGRLAFSERITEGRSRCIARIRWAGGSS